MRFVTYQVSGDPEDRVGVLHDGAVHRLDGVARLLDLLGDDGTALRTAGDAALSGSSEVVDLEAVRLAAPIPIPPSIRDFMTFESHIVGTSFNYGPETLPPKIWYRQPLFYFSNPAAMFATGDDVPMPPGAKSFDFEAEVAAVIGSPGSDLSIDDALDHVVGYMVLNDWSARDLQAREMQGLLGPAKGKDTATTIGPSLVTADELAPFASGPSLALEMEVELNGEQFGTDRLDHQAWGSAQMIAYASRGTNLRAGDILGSGTCGNGCIAEKWGREGLESQRALVPGDVVTIRVEHLGEVTNRVVEGSPMHDLGPIHAESPYQK